MAVRLVMPPTAFQVVPGSPLVRSVARGHGHSSSDGRTAAPAATVGASTALGCAAAVLTAAAVGRRGRTSRVMRRALDLKARLKRENKMKNRHKLREMREEAKRQREEEEWRQEEEQRQETERRRAEKNRVHEERRQLAEQWADHLQWMLDLEYKEEERVIKERLEKWPISLLVKNGMCVTGVVGEPVGKFFGDHLIKFTSKNGKPLPRHEFQRGDEMMITRDGEKPKFGDEGQKDETQFRGQVVSLEDRVINGVSTPTAILAVMQEMPEKKGVWRIDRGVNTIVYERTTQALTYFGSEGFAAENVRRVIVGGDEGTVEDLNAPPQPLEIPERCFERCNDSQTEALNSLVNRRITLIQGPPGCGKTYTACAALEALCENNDGTILACADSHVAVDQILGGLLARGVNAVRYGHPASINEDLRHVSVQSLMEKHDRYQEFQEMKTQLSDSVQSVMKYKRQVRLEERRNNGEGVEEGEDEEADEEEEDTGMTEFTIVLRRDSVDESLGADVSIAIASEALRIEGIDEMGSIGDWNTRHPDKAVQVGDLFVAFNGIRGSQAMLEELRKQPALEVTVERLAEEDEDWDEEQSQYEGLLEAAKKAEQTNRRKCRALESEMTSDIIRGSKVVCATLAGCGSDALKMFKFNAVLVDEATQASEPRALIAVKSLTQEGRLVLVGDQKQLPPTCVCREAADMGLSLSLFERLLRKDDHLKPVMLTTQFRMHPIISQWPSKAFYQNKLMNGQQAMDRVPAPGFPWPSAGPAAFIKVVGKEEKSLDGASKINREEIDMVRKVVDSFLKEMKPRDIGVISPYRGQVGQLKKLLPKGVEAKTVDGFQGREKPVIIFSCVRSNPGGAVGFLKDRRRLNVALTRAQRGLVVIGDPNTLQSNQVWSSWLEFVKENNLSVDFP